MRIPQSREYHKRMMRENRMKKKNLVVGFGLLVVGFGLGTIFMNSEKPKSITLDHLSNGSMIAMYIQDEEGNYQLSDGKKFPTDGYVLNTEKSSCKNGGVISQNASTKALSLKVKTSDECTVYFDVVTSANPSADMLIAKANDASITTYASGDKKEMFAFDHPEAEQTIGWTEEERRDYRYIGNEPNNYIIFNDETWRIIGVFTVETESEDKEPLIKIIRSESIGSLLWNSHDSGNNWPTSSLQKLLNEDYFNQSGKYTSTSSVKGLSVASQQQVSKVKTYLAGVTISSGPLTYRSERGTTAYVDNVTSVVQYVGLLYPSDYIYTYANGVDSNCYSDGFECSSGVPSSGWLYNNSYHQWTISSPGTNKGNAYGIAINGIVSGNLVDTNRAVRPVVFLMSSVKIISGDGSQENPYVIE